MALVKGANAPLIRKTLLAELEAEKEVLEGKRERAVVSRLLFEIIRLLYNDDDNNTEGILKLK